MKSLRRTIVVLITFSLITACYAVAKPAPTPQEPSQAEDANEAQLQVEAAREQMEAARELVEAAREQAEAAREQMESAKSTGSHPLSSLNIADLRLNFGFPFSHSGAGAVLVIPSSEMKAENLTAIVEDMTVMSRIFDEQLGKEQSRQTWFSGNFLGQSRSAETMYLQGYGALFLKKVDFPLSPPPKTQEPEKKTKEEAIDPVWEQTRQDIYEPQEDRESQEPSEVKYDAEKVENLKTNLIKALKHATNIRSLKPDEAVVIAVAGSGYSSKAKKVISHVIVQNHDRRSTGTVLPSLPNDSGPSSTATLIIRTKRADIDSFAKGNLDLEKFRQRVQIFTQ